MSKNTFEDYLKEKNIKMTEEDKFYCLSMINTDMRLLNARKSNKSFLNGLVMDYLFWDKDKQIADLETKLADLQQEQITEMQEHQKAMKLADKTIKELEANLELHKQSNMVLNDQLNKATEHLGELEDKLAESEKEIKEWIAVRDDKNKVINKQTEKINQLKQQLADTEAQNKRVLEKLELIVSANQELEQKLAESENSLKSTIDHYEKYCAELNSQNVMLHASAFNYNQDKISFCIEQLSTLRNFVNSKAIFSKNECECEVCKDISQTIANRIKRLEEGEWT